MSAHAWVVNVISDGDVCATFVFGYQPTVAELAECASEGEENIVELAEETGGGKSATYGRHDLVLDGHYGTERVEWARYDIIQSEQR